MQQTLCLVYITTLGKLCQLWATTAVVLPQAITPDLCLLLMPCSSWVIPASYSEQKAFHCSRIYRLCRRISLQFVGLACRILAAQFCSGQHKSVSAEYVNLSSMHNSTLIYWRHLRSRSRLLVFEVDVAWKNVTDNYILASFCLLAEACYRFSQ